MLKLLPEESFAQDLRTEGTTVVVKNFVNLAAANEGTSPASISVALNLKVKFVGLA